MCYYIYKNKREHTDHESEDKEMIKRITEFVSGNHPSLGGTHYTVYYKSGRKVNYYGVDTLPMSVVNFLTSKNTVSETLYIEDTFLKCINKRITYKAAD